MNKYPIEITDEAHISDETIQRDIREFIEFLLRVVDKRKEKCNGSS